MDFRPFVSYDVDFYHVCQWNADPYPNGVHSLPFKDELRWVRSPCRFTRVSRAGGHTKIAVDFKTEKHFHWRASQTVLALQWLISDKEIKEKKAADTEFPLTCPVLKMRLIIGHKTDQMKAAKAKLWGWGEKLCCSITAPATATMPDGINVGDLDYYASSISARNIW